VITRSALAKIGTVMVVTASTFVVLAARVVRAPTSGEQVVRAMHDRYAGTWFKTLTFVQKTTRFDSTGQQTVTTWYESASLPSRLRIDIGSPKEGNGYLFTADSTFIIKGGQLTRASAGGNSLITILFDVYVDPVDLTLAQLKAAGYDVGKMHREQWDGRSTYVVGADSGDLVSPQFWVEADRLIEVRQLGRTHGPNPRQADYRFENYVRLGGGWLSERNDFRTDGKPSQLEEYSEVKVNVPLSEDLFDPRHWTPATHWVDPR
jgi:hypothetical protein